MTTPHGPLDLGDLAELAELVQFLDAWLACDHERLDQSLTRFVGHASYNIDRLREDLARFAVLLDADPEPSASMQQPPQTPSTSRSEHAGARSTVDTQARQPPRESPP